ncbi:MAG TPA: hypothetical protein VMU33_06120 [Burkholderiaceae bacterium]|nr:hypothetical protein [Burkholderiaceae bacterium]
MPAIALAAMALATIWAPATARAADGVATITVLEGNAWILRGTAKLIAAEGVRLRPDDIVETAPSAFARLEFAPGPVVDVGAATRLMLAPAGAPGPGRPGMYLLAGWLKLTSPRDPAAPAGSPASAFASPRMDLAGIKGVTLAQVGADDSMVFIESGEARLVDRRARAAAPLVLQSGDYVELRGAKESDRAQRPSAAFLSSMPVPFRDSLPPRAAEFAERNVAPREAGTFGYKDVQAWLTVDRLLGRRLVRLWAPKASDPAFRAGLTTNLAAHPEWFPILYPDCCNAPPPNPATTTGHSPPPAPEPQQAPPRPAAPATLPSD